MNGKIEPVDVRIVKSPEELTSLAVEFGAWSNFTVPQIGTNTGTLPPILSRRPTRDEAYIFIPPQAAGATSVILAHRPDYVSNASNPQGAIIPVPGAGATAFQIKYKGQQPVYAVGVGGPATISTLDQAQSASEAQAEEIPEYLDEEYELEGQGGSGPSYQ